MIKCYVSERSEYSEMWPILLIIVDDETSFIFNYSSGHMFNLDCAYWFNII